MNKTLKKLALKRYKKLKEKAQAKALSEGGKKWDYWSHLSESEKRKLTRYGNIAHKKEIDPELDGTLELTGFDKSGNGLGQDFKDDLSERIYREHGVAPSKLPAVAPVDTSIEITFMDWYCPEEDKTVELKLENGSLAGYDAITVEDERGLVVRRERVKRSEAQGYYESKAWAAGVRGPND